MTTEALVETVLDYPLMVSLYAFNSISKGFEVLAEQFNGMAELIQRDDGAEKLLNAYTQSQTSIFSTT